jgi:hypothetical protein
MPATKLGAVAKRAAKGEIVAEAAVKPTEESAKSE